MSEDYAIPSVPGLIGVGNALQLDPTAIHVKLSDWERKFGPLFYFRALNHRYLVVSDIDIVSNVMRDRPGGFRRHPNLQSVMKEVGVDGLLAAEGSDWVKQRHAMDDGFRGFELDRYQAMFGTIETRCRQRFRTLARVGSGVDVFSEFQKLLIDAMAIASMELDPRVSLGDPMNFEPLLNGIFPTIGSRITSPVRYWKWLPLPQNRKIQRNLLRLTELIESRIEIFRAGRPTSEEAEFRSILRLLVMAQGAQRLDDEALVGNVITILLGGLDPTAAVLAWSLFFLAQNGKVIEGLRCDVERNGLESRYLGAVIDETMRLKPPLPLLFMQSIADAEFKGCRVVAGTNIVLSLYNVNRDPSHFRDPLDFRPERWLGEKTDRTSVALPFGRGPRYCIGRQLALFQVRSLLAGLALHFDFHLQGAMPRELLEFTMRPGRSFMKISERACGGSEGNL
ncbi:MAG: cytochrome P450 [Gammaproteobacteria bacterium]|nr:cytochrome P450 [Gammaproteobacteria bacterium]